MTVGGCEHVASGMETNARLAANRVMGGQNAINCVAVRLPIIGTPGGAYGCGVHNSVARSQR